MTTLKCDVCSGTIENLREIAPSCKAPGCTGHYRAVTENAMTKCERCGRDQPVGFEYGCGVCGWNTLAEKEQRERAEKAEKVLALIGERAVKEVFGAARERDALEAEHIVAAYKAWREYALSLASWVRRRFHVKFPNHRPRKKKCSRQ